MKKYTSPVVIGHPLPDPPVKGCTNKMCFCTGECRKTEEEVQKEKEFREWYNYPEDSNGTT